MEAKQQMRTIVVCPKWDLEDIDGMWFWEAGLELPYYVKAEVPITTTFDDAVNECISIASDTFGWCITEYEDAFWADEVNKT